MLILNPAKIIKQNTRCFEKESFAFLVILNRKVVLTSDKELN